jgi:hypothetical protein
MPATSAPFIFITTHSINEGELEAYTEQQAAFARFVEAHEPRLTAFHAYTNHEGTEVTFVFLFPDAAAAEAHLEVAHELIGRGLRLAQTTRVEVCGAPGPLLQQAVAANTESGVPVSVKARPLAGFSRSAVAPGTASDARGSGGSDDAR